MDILQNFINDMNKQMAKESGEEYNLGDLIKDLEKYKGTFKEVEFDDGTIPTEFDSWRGSYCELALGYKEKGIMHNTDLYRQAYNANGSIFVGYKGGEFEMDLDIPIHQANYGETGVENKETEEYEYKKIIGITEKDNKIIILTRVDED